MFEGIKERERTSSGTPKAEQKLLLCVLLQPVHKTTRT